MILGDVCGDELLLSTLGGVALPPAVVAAGTAAPAATRAARKESTVEGKSKHFLAPKNTLYTAGAELL